MKVCSRCKETKEFSLFSKKKSSKDGFDNYCKICRNKITSDWKLDNKKLIDNYNSEYYKNNIESEKQRTLIWSTNNPEKVRISNRQACKKWAMSNKEMINTRAAKRRAQGLNATPSWLTKEHHEQIAELYEICRMFKLYTGEEYHVDHIVPLQGESVCGLHVPWNLQVLPAKENLIKSNKIVEEQI